MLCSTRRSCAKTINEFMGRGIRPFLLAEACVPPAGVVPDKSEAIVPVVAELEEKLKLGLGMGLELEWGRLPPAAP